MPVGRASTSSVRKSPRKSVPSQRSLKAGKGAAGVSGRAAADKAKAAAVDAAVKAKAVADSKAAQVKEKAAKAKAAADAAVKAKAVAESKAAKERAAKARAPHADATGSRAAKARAAVGAKAAQVAKAAVAREAQAAVAAAMDEPEAADPEVADDDRAGDVVAAAGGQGAPESVQIITDDQPLESGVIPHADPLVMTLVSKEASYAPLVAALVLVICGSGSKKLTLGMIDQFLTLRSGSASAGLYSDVVGTQYEASEGVLGELVGDFPGIMDGVDPSLLMNQMLLVGFAAEVRRQVAASKKVSRFTFFSFFFPFFFCFCLEVIPCSAIVAMSGVSDSRRCDNF